MNFIEIAQSMSVLRNSRYGTWVGKEFIDHSDYMDMRYVTYYKIRLVVFLAGGTMEDAEKAVKIFTKLCPPWNPLWQ